jgi:hypothetical protein
MLLLGPDHTDLSSRSRETADWVPEGLRLVGQTETQVARERSLRQSCCLL